MRVLRPRKRLVNFRLTEQEYDELASACSSQGGRSLSKFARGAVLERARSEPAPETTLRRRFLVLNDKTSQLQASLARVAEKLDAIAERILNPGDGSGAPRN